eukprot:gene28856-35839_t
MLSMQGRRQAKSLKRKAVEEAVQLDDFDRENAIGFATHFTVSLPEDTRKHLAVRRASMWTDGLAKVEDWSKLEGAVPLTGGKLEVFHSSAGSGNSNVKTTFCDTLLDEEDRKHLDVVVEHVTKAHILEHVKGDYILENAAFFINMDLQQQRGKKKAVTLSTLT